MAKAGNAVLPEWKLDHDWLLPVKEWRMEDLAAPRLTELGSTDLGFVDLTEDPDNFLRSQQLLAGRTPLQRGDERAAGVEALGRQFL